MDINVRGKDLGERLKKLRKEAGYSQDFIAQILPTRDRSGYARVESGERYISMMSLHHLARLYHVDLSDIVPMEDVYGKHGSDAMAADVKVLFAMLPKGKQKTIYNQILRMLMKPEDDKKNG